MNTHSNDPSADNLVLCATCCFHESEVSTRGENFCEYCSAAACEDHSNTEHPSLKHLRLSFRAHLVDFNPLCDRENVLGDLTHAETTRLDSLEAFGQALLEVINRIENDGSFYLGELNPPLPRRRLRSRPA